MRLIDADAFLERMKGTDRYFSVKFDIENQPTVDAVEVVHGEWNESKVYNEGFWVCSSCNFVSQAIAAPRLYNYCPNCGAKMDGKKVE